MRRRAGCRDGELTDEELGATPLEEEAACTTLLLLHAAAKLVTEVIIGTDVKLLF